MWTTIFSIVVVVALFLFIAFQKYKKHKQPPDKYWEGKDPARDKDPEVEKEKQRRGPPPGTPGPGGF